MLLLERSFLGGPAPRDWEAIPAAPTDDLPSEGWPVCGSQELRILLPKVSSDQLTIDIELATVAGDIVAIECGNHDIDVSLQIDGQPHPRHAILKASMCPLAQGKLRLAPQSGVRHVRINIASDLITASVDGQTCVQGTDPFFTPSGRLLWLVLWGRMSLRNITVHDDNRAPLQRTKRPQPAQEFWLEANVDFHGYMGVAPFTHKTFDRLFEEFADWGVRRVHWIDYGRRREGWWDHAAGVSDNALRTMDNVGEILPAAVTAAHRHGVELYALFKPFDMAVGSIPEGTPDGRATAGVPRIGGPLVGLPRFCAEHRDWVSSRRPGSWGDAQNQTIDRIELVKDDEAVADFSVADIELFVSDDNGNYHPFLGHVSRSEAIESVELLKQTIDGPRSTGRRRNARVMRLSGLSIAAKYILLRVPGRDGSFVNTLADMVRVHGELGIEQRLTLGLSPRGGVSADPLRRGIAFDYFPGIPSAVFPGFEPMSFPIALDQHAGVLAIARGKNRDQIAVMSPAYDRVCDWWLAWIDAALDDGADGIELRERNHHSPLSWLETGFEQPVRDAMIQQTGVDPWSDPDPDQAALRQIRGQFYTRFLRRAKALVASRGRKLGLHVSVGMDMDTRQGAAMQMRWDWRTWLQEGLADSVTMKEIWPGSRFANELHEVASARNVPVIFTPYGGDCGPNESGHDGTMALRIARARELGFSGFQQYVPLVRGLADESITRLNPVACQTLRSMFRGR